MDSRQDTSYQKAPAFLAPVTHGIHRRLLARSNLKVAKTHSAGGRRKIAAFCLLQVSYGLVFFPWYGYLPRPRPTLRMLRYRVININNFIRL